MDSGLVGDSAGASQNLQSRNRRVWKPLQQLARVCDLSRPHFLRAHRRCCFPFAIEAAGHAATVPHLGIPNRSRGLHPDRRNYFARAVRFSTRDNLAWPVDCDLGNSRVLVGAYKGGSRSAG